MALYKGLFVQIKFKKLHKEAILPKYETLNASGMDIRAMLKEALNLKPFDRVAIPTGLSVEIPEGFELQVRPRSGLSINKGLMILNSPGTIDSDYRGEIKILVINLNQAKVQISNGERIAQLVLSRIYRAEPYIADTLSDTERSIGGLGHTGQF